MIDLSKAEAINSIEEINKLYMDNQRLIGFFMSKQKKPIGMTIEEYESELMISLWKSARTYDSTIAQFSTYAVRGMFMTRWRIVQNFTRSKKLASIREDDIESSRNVDIDEGIYRQELTEIINSLVEPLSETQRDYLKRIGSGESRIDIARSIGKKTNTVSECCREAVRNIKKRIARENIKCPI